MFRLQEDFESEFVDQTHKYYARKASVMADEESFPHYMTKAEAFLEVLDWLSCGALTTAFRASESVYETTFMNHQRLSCSKRQSMSC